MKTITVHRPKAPGLWLLPLMPPVSGFGCKRSVTEPEAAPPAPKPTAPSKPWLHLPLFSARKLPPMPPTYPSLQIGASPRSLPVVAQLDWDEYRALRRRPDNSRQHPSLRTHRERMMRLRDLFRIMLKNRIGGPDA